MAFDLSTVSSQLGSFIPSGSSLLQNLALGAATSVVLGGLKSQEGQNAVDPLHLIFHPSGQTSTVVGKTITAAAYAALPAAQQAELRAEGYSIV